MDPSSHWSKLHRPEQRFPHIAIHSTQPESVPVTNSRRSRRVFVQQPLSANPTSKILQNIQETNKIQERDSV